MRQGYTKVYSGTDCHSVWSGGSYCFFVENTALKAFTPDTTNVTDLSYTLHGDKAVYDQLGTLVYATDGRDLVAITNGDTARKAGVPVPQSLPKLSYNSTGTLYPGTYQVTITYVDSDGRESGAPLAAVVEVDQQGGIYLEDIPNDSAASTVRVYASTANGETLYEVLEVPAGVSTALVTTVRDGARPLDCQFLEPMVPGQCIAFYRGYLLVAQGDKLYWSEPNDYERTKPHYNFYQFPVDVTSIMPMNDGVFVSADHLYYVSGTDFTTANLEVREHSVQVVPGTETRITGGDVILENVPTGFKWIFTTNRGVMLGGPGGMLFNLTEQNVFVDFASEGVGYFRSDEGMNQYVSLLKNPDNSRMRVGDTATADVIRNGITVT
jgi:hypothetical protein